MQPNCADSINTVDVNLTGHWSGLKYHEFTKKRILCTYFVFMHVRIHISKKLSILSKPVKLTYSIYIEIA